MRPCSSSAPAHPGLYLQFVSRIYFRGSRNHTISQTQSSLWYTALRLRAVRLRWAQFGCTACPPSKHSLGRETLRVLRLFVYHENSLASSTARSQPARHACASGERICALVGRCAPAPLTTRWAILVVGVRAQSVRELGYRNNHRPGVYLLDTKYIYIGVEKESLVTLESQCT